MSKRNTLSSVGYSSLDLAVENTEPVPKRRKSQETEFSVESVLVDDDTETMLAAVDDAVKPVLSPSMKGKNNVVSTVEHKQVRYDRQLRLWGDHGQGLLESARVCLLNATATGTEILKSLVLPGVGMFTIIDGNVVSGADVGSNFFLDSRSIGQPRAKVACEILQELNPDTRGNFQSLSPDDYISQHGLSAFDQFTMVIGTKLNRRTVATLGSYLFKRGTPLVLCQCYGLVGYVRVLVREHPVVESHPENPLPNFMLDRPFPELVQLVSSMDLDSMNPKDHSHTPYLILLFKALELWRSKKNDPTAFPRSYKEKKELKDILLSMRQPDEKGSLDEENFQEAVNAVNTAFMPTAIPANIRDILDSQSAIVVTSSSSDFRILCHALRRFVAEYDRLPVRGTVPDMIADSERYIRLQNVFLRKAEKDASIVHGYASEISRPFNREIASARTRLFCKNSAFLHVIKGHPPSDQEEAAFAAELLNEDNMSALWYLILLECEAFYDTHGRYPGTDANAIDDDERFVADKKTLMDTVEGKIKKILPNGEKPGKVAEAVEEACRYGGSELHTMASFLGGVSAQEVIKLITNQYVPLNNTFVFDGNSSVGSVFAV